MFFIMFEYNLKQFAQWPKRAILLWEGCDRTPRYHNYPDVVKNDARERNIKLDSRANGPAIAAYRFAGGRRPGRFGSSNEWSIHHLYSGKFPHWDRERTLHATEDGLHFTQSAGLIALHPIADALCDEFPFFSWCLRSKSFSSFGYDPDGVFSTERDKYGFATGHSCEIYYSA